MAKELCQDCGVVFEPKSKKGMICLSCYRKRMSQYAKARNLSRIGNQAYSEKRARAKIDGGNDDG